MSDIDAAFIEVFIYSHFLLNLIINHAMQIGRLFTTVYLLRNFTFKLGHYPKLAYNPVLLTFLNLMTLTFRA